MELGMFDKLFENIDHIANKVGLSPEALESATGTLQAKIGRGDDQMAALIETAREHGLPVEKLQEAFAHAATHGGGNPAEAFASILANGLFGKG
jgi:hypothetical protein